MAEKRNRESAMRTEPPPSPTLAPPGPPNEAPPPEGAQAQATPKEEQNQGALGMQLPTGGEIGGGFVQYEVFPEDVPGADPDHALRLQRMARGSTLMRELGGDSRPVDEWGLVGKCNDKDCRGDVWVGHGILISVDNLEKIRVHDGARITDGVYANTRNFSQGLMAGDVKEKF